MMSGGGFFVLFGLIYLGVIVYILMLATRFVTAVEQIARSLEAKPGPQA